MANNAEAMGLAAGHFRTAVSSPRVLAESEEAHDTAAD